MVYSQDLSEHIGLNNNALLASAIAISMLLNPVFGIEKNIIGSGLMTKKPYQCARSQLLQNMQDIPDRKCPPDLSGSSESSGCNDLDAPKQVNAKYQQPMSY